MFHTSLCTIYRLYVVTILFPGKMPRCENPTQCAVSETLQFLHLPESIIIFGIFIKTFVCSINISFSNTKHAIKCL